jgi:nucleosome binding factor SPN SPT16 subunit
MKTKLDENEMKYEDEDEDEDEGRKKKKSLVRLCRSFKSLFLL